MARTAEQQAAVTATSEYLCVDAGAGSGKTRVLVDRVVHLLERRQAKLDEIVAITFTEKAAAEMKARLRAAFHEKGPIYDPQAMSFWRDLERRVEAARISTIHSFCAALLRESALDVGIDPDFTVLAEAEAKLLKTDMVTDTLHALLDESDEAAMHVAAELGMGPLCGLIGAMLNKRAVMARLRDQHPLGDPEALAQHWAKLAEAQWAARIEALGRSAELRAIRNALRTFDGACAKDSAKREGMRREMLAALEEILGGADTGRVEVLLEQVAAMSAKGARAANWPSKEMYDRLGALQKRVVEIARDHARPALDETIEHEAACLTCAFFATYEHVAAAFQEAKAARTGLDFDDLIADVLAMLRENDALRSKVGRGIKHLLIDEFQDTDSAQIEVAQLLAREPGGPALFIVGDAKQSIYNFRGAEVEVFQGEKDAANDLVRLGTNFRALPDVLGFVNDFFARSGLLEAVEPAYGPLTTHREAASACRIEFLVPKPEEGAKAEDYRRKEAELIAARIAALCGGANRAEVYDKDRDTCRPADFGDVAILFRAMGDVHLYEEPLRRRGIPYQVVAGAGFYERQEILDVRNLLTVVADPWNEMALLGFLRGPLAAMSDESLLRLAGNGGLVQAFRQGVATPCLSAVAPEGLDEEQAARLESARKLIDDLRAHAELPLPAFLRYMLVRTGLEAILLSQFLGVQKASNVRKVLDLADDFARTRLPKLGAFIRFLDEMASYPEVREGEAAMSPEGAVTLMTVHKAKGLEFPVVFVADCSRGLNVRQADRVVVHRRLGLAAKATDAYGEPASPAILQAMARDRDALDRAEHARVLYVAMTRARDWLFLSGAPAAAKGSWLEALDTVYGVLDKADGERFSGGSWQACVGRLATEVKVAADETKGEKLPSLDALEARVGRVGVSAVTRRTFAVTTLLDAMGYPLEHDAAAPSSPKRGRIDARRRGELVHQMLERWDGNSDVCALIESICRRECPALRVRKELAADLAAIAERFGRSALGKRMAREYPVLREHAFLLRVGDALVEGIIDAILPDGTLVDYKTGIPRETARAHYEAQLCLYAAAVRTLAKKDPPAAFLYYADTGEAHEVDVSPRRVEAVVTEAKEAIEELHGGPGH